MSRKHFSEEQIIYALKQAENGKPVRDVCRELGVSEQSFYTWKRIVAELTLDKHILQEVLLMA